MECVVTGTTSAIDAAMGTLPGPSLRVCNWPDAAPLCRVLDALEELLSLQSTCQPLGRGRSSDAAGASREAAEATAQLSFPDMIFADTPTGIDSQVCSYEGNDAGRLLLNSGLWACCRGCLLFKLSGPCGITFYSVGIYLKKEQRVHDTCGLALNMTT